METKYRYIIGFKNEELYMISSMSQEEKFEESIKKFNNGLGYRYEEKTSNLDIRNCKFEELIKSINNG